MKLIYWKAKCLNDSSCYDIRCKTKKEVVAHLKEIDDSQGYGKPVKVVYEYRDSFELMDCCLDESRGGGLQGNLLPG